MLEELKIQFDVVIADSVKSWEQYKLLILPENVEITFELARRVREHISRGGAFFACGESAAKEFGAELGVKYQGASGYDAVYFNMNGDYSDGLEDMYLSLYAPACAAQVTDGVGESRLVKPYYNREWKGTHSIFYLPPQEEVDLPFIVRRGNCIWCAGDIFSGYANRGALHLRHIVRNVIFSLLEEPLVKVGKLPASSRVVLNEKDGDLSVSVIAYSPEQRAYAMVVEDPLAVVNGSFKVLTSGRSISGAYLVPEMTPLEFSTDGNYTEVKLPPFEGFALVVLK
jgi:hypothetical protein